MFSGMRVSERLTNVVSPDWLITLASVFSIQCSNAEANDGSRHTLGSRARTD